jgi:hypothetical protein
VIAANTGANYVVFDGSNWMTFLSATLAGATNMSVFSSFQLNQTPGTSYPSLYNLGGMSSAPSGQFSGIAGATGIGVELQGNARIQAGNWRTGTYMSTGTNGLVVGSAATLSQIFDFAQGTASAQLNGQTFASRASGTTTTALSEGVNGFLGVYGSIDSGGTRYRGQFGDLIVATSALGNAAAQEINTYLSAKYQSAGTPVTSTSTASLSGVSTASVYDLGSSANSTVFIDQVLDRRSAGEVADTVLVAGSDWVATGAGNDTIHVKDLNFRSIDGGQGNDSLVLDSSYSTAGSMVLADFVSNSRGMSGVAADDNRVNTAGFHKLMGIEKIDTSPSPASLTLHVSAADVAQLPDSNTLGLVLGDGHSVVPTGFASGLPTWGYYSFNGTLYDQRWTLTSGDQTYTLYAFGGPLPQYSGSFSTVPGSSGSDTLGSSATSTSQRLAGGLGNDTLTGGSAADLFSFA